MTLNPPELEGARLEALRDAVARTETHDAGSFDDPAVVHYVTQNFPELLPCPRADRTITRVNAHVSTFVTEDGSRGVGWMVPPSSTQADDGKLSILTCHPTEGLTAAECDTIIADYIARLESPPPAAPSTTTPGHR